MKTAEFLLEKMVDCLPAHGLVEKLKEKKSLRVKLGVDPTRPDIHIGHAIVLKQLKRFQDLGHEVIFLIGDFTAMIGDPSGRDVTRPPLTMASIKENAKSYLQQVGKILDLSKLSIVYNSEWLGAMSAQQLIELSSLQTVARMLERDDFSKRYQNGQSIAIHEFLYPLLQGYDSVALKSDIELGGTDQTFNLLMGRELQKHYGQSQQVVMTFPLLEGLDGVKKMSKSYGNTIGLDDHPDDMFGKVMSISDTLMWRYFELISNFDVTTIKGFKEDTEAGKNPRDVKLILAEDIVSQFHNETLASQAKEHFLNRFQQKQIPDDRPVEKISKDDLETPIIQLLKKASLITSTSEGLRLLKQGAIKVDGEKILENHPIKKQQCIVTVGKRRIIEFIKDQ
ncbi:MAG: tyrosine--tRNA ligase [Legionellales bacterium]|nr:tyrosine--tRNA ligase [Legionellales bacterium]OUX67748.1 MAG: tyrosine--tRNA ligase [bacterium TMED178]|tara:strand:+ start:1427 stop:2611 length:1185 start_codon:yes stop_codon:yes gene_type:complete